MNSPNHWKFNLFAAVAHLLVIILSAGQKTQAAFPYDDYIPAKQFFDIHNKEDIRQCQ